LQNNVEEYFKIG